MNSAVNDNACDLIGITRLSALAPDFPRSIISNIGEEDTRTVEVDMRLLQVRGPWYLSLLPSQQARQAFRGGLQTQVYCDHMKKLEY